MPEKLMTAKEVARYLGISEKEVENLVTKGKLPAYKIGEAFVRFKREHVDAIKNAISTPSPKLSRAPQSATFFDRLLDFFYFNDFYIISLILIIILVIIIIYF